ncbi:hypothetical protein [Nocardia sp. NPDC051750]|uniref:hypothetical protein n=1 Tax=Nocardia sp. NPDC051750 TaxID=3364325 RepID=UPI0037A41FB0
MTGSCVRAYAVALRGQILHRDAENILREKTDNISRRIAENYFRKFPVNKYPSVCGSRDVCGNRSTRAYRARKTVRGGELSVAAARGDAVGAGCDGAPEKRI